MNAQKTPETSLALTPCEDGQKIAICELGQALTRRLDSSFQNREKKISVVYSVRAPPKAVRQY